MRICCDIDGVLADVREYVIKYLPHDWKTYFSNTEKFPIIGPVASLLYSLSINPNHEIYLVTGRPESNRNYTMLWLLHRLPICDIPSPYILMRPDSDYRPTHEIKLEWFKELKPDLIIDDDPKVIEVALKEGFIVLQVHGFRVTENDMVPENYLEE